ncbi:serine hydrolase domain-containing protein [Agrococcus sp. SL85]|uniref:serine hydrolase domain-containing protein n=1 Tax=Agrococcus sp. SL85 TaxID=2995141 RepID=UPI003B63E476
MLGEDGDVAAAGVGLLAADGQRPVGTASMFHAASMSKLVTAVVVLRLVARGLLDLDADIAGRTGGWTLPRAQSDAAVSLRTLLSHHGGIEDDDDAFGPLRDGQATPSLEEVLRGEHPLVPRPVRGVRAPGEAFVYSDAGYCVVEQVLASSTRTPFAELARELVLEPLGMARSGFGVPPRDDADVADGHDARGAVIAERRPDYPYQAAAGLWSTPSDLALLLRELGLALRGVGALGIPPSLAAAQPAPAAGRPVGGPRRAARRRARAAARGLAGMGRGVPVHAPRRAARGPRGRRDDERRPGRAPGGLDHGSRRRAARGGGAVARGLRPRQRAVRPRAPRARRAAARGSAAGSRRRSAGGRS